MGDFPTLEEQLWNIARSVAFKPQLDYLGNIVGTLAIETVSNKWLLAR